MLKEFEEVCKKLKIILNHKSYNFFNKSEKSLNLPIAIELKKV